MPRTGKAQRTQAVTDVYGEGIDSIEAQQAIPLPDNSGLPTPPPPAPAGPGELPPEQRMAAALEASGGLGVDPAAMLSAPSDSPGEPVTAGLTSGPGAGPEALHQQPAAAPASVASFFSLASEVFGQDPDLRQLASRAQQRGL